MEIAPVIVGDASITGILVFKSDKYHLIYDSLEQNKEWPG
jgi:hypothetical protein